jgi:hypothetical protein
MAGKLFHILACAISGKRENQWIQQNIQGAITGHRRSMKIKVLLLSVVSILIIGLAAAAYWWLSRPQVIVFSDDAKLTLVKVEYGRRHAPPTAGKPAAGARGAARGNSFTTDRDTLVLWVRMQYDSKQYHYFQYFVYDKGGTGCGQAGPRNWRNTGNEVVAVQFDAFPRRQGKFVVRVQEQSNGGQEMSEQKFVVSNPAGGKSFAKLTAEPLPSTKEDNDVSVTLAKLVAGAEMPYQRNQDDPEDAANKGVQAVFHVERGGKPVSNWQPVSVETSDATGNRVNGGITQNNWQDSSDTVTYQYGLWPDEPAWKMKFEFSQQSDFADNELWTVKNIPVQPGRQQDFWNFNNMNRRNGTNSAFAEADLNGIHLKIFPATQFTDQNFGNGQMGGGLQIQATPSFPAGMRLTLAKLTDDQGVGVQNYNSGSSGSGTSMTYGYQLQNIAGVTNLNLTLALHKSRFVEFTAKPAKPETSNKD